MTGRAIDVQERRSVPGQAAGDDRPALDGQAHGKLSKVLEQRVDIPLERYAQWFGTVPLERVLKGTGDLPSVVGTRPMNEVPFPDVGSRRLVQLSDGGTAMEEVLHNDPGRYFAYIVWGYTTPRGRAVAYGYGEFWFEPAGPSTLVRWRYSFKLKPGMFPGYLGAFGRWLFRAMFLDTSYERFMRLCLKAMAEEAAASVR